MNRENILKHFLTIGSGTIVVMLLNLVTAPIITRLVDPNEYGVQSVFTMYATFAASILYLGQDQALLRFFYVKEEDCYKRTLLYRCVKYPALFCGIVGIVLVSFKIIGGIPFEYGIGAVICLCIYIFILTLDRFASILMRLTYHVKVTASCNVISKLAYLLISVGLIFMVQGYDSEILIAATVLSAALALAINLWSGHTFWNFLREHHDKECISTRTILQYGLPFIMSNGILSFFYFIDKMTIKAFGTFADVGIYSSALGLASASSIIQTTFCTLWSPLAFERYEKDPESNDLYIKGHNIITVIMFAIGLTVIFCKEIFVVVLGEKYREASYLLPFLIFNPIMMTVSETTVLGLYFKKKTKQQIIPPLVACICNTVGNLVLVPVMGNKGAAISTGISYIVFFTVRTILGLHYYYIDINLKKYYFITFLVLLYAFYSTYVKFNVFSILYYLICMSLLIVLYQKTVRLLLFYICDFVKVNILKTRK